jgi:hypothetical protein
MRFALWSEDKGHRGRNAQEGQRGCRGSEALLSSLRRCHTLCLHLADGGLGGERQTGGSGDGSEVGQR